MSSLNEIVKISVYIQKELQNWFQKIVFCFRCGHVFCFYWEIAFKYVLFINITKFRFFLFCSDEADTKRWNSFKYCDLYVIIFLEWVILWQEAWLCLEKKNLKSSLLHGRKSWNLKCKFKYCFLRMLRIKVGPSPYKNIYLICFTESPLKIMKDAFILILKALFNFKILIFLQWIFGHVGKRALLER